MFQQYVEIVTFGFLVIDAIILTRDFYNLEVHSSSESAFALFLTPSFSFDFLLRLTALIMFACCVYTLISISIYRKTPLTILRTEINVSVNKHRDHAVFEKTQTLRTNVPNVTAYYAEAEPTSATGECKNALMYCHCPGAKNMKDEVEFTNQPGSRGFQAVHTFGRPLRYRWYMLIVPKVLMNKSFLELPTLLQKNLTLRTQEFTCVNEFNQPKPSIEFTAGNYPQRSIYITIDFEDNLPGNIKVRKRALHGMVDVPAMRLSRSKIRIYVPSLIKETLRISWDDEVPLALLEQKSSSVSSAGNAATTQQS